MGFSSHLWRIVRTTAIAIPIGITISDCVGYVAKVEGASMQPALNPDGNSDPDYVLLWRWGIKNYNIKHGDIVSLSSPRDPNQKLIKRVIGLEGDLVKTLSFRTRYIHVPEGHCWLEGDHHKHSLDSNVLGPIALGLIYAKATAIVWPPNRWQTLESRLPVERIPTRNKFLSKSVAVQAAQS